MKKVIILGLILILLPSVSAISNVQHSVDGNKATIRFQGTPPFLINIRADKNIGQPGGYVWARTNSNTFTLDLGFAINPSNEFYYGIKDAGWSSVESFELGETIFVEDICEDNDFYCPWECNDWGLDTDCGIPEIYDFVEPRSPQDYLNSDMVHWDDAEWRNYQPLIDKVNEITNGITDDFERAKAIANWVKNSRPYGLPSPANEGKSIIEIFNSNTGVCMDAAILTAAMFRIANIPSRAILPGFHEYTEGYVNGRWVGFDATFSSGDAQIIDPITSILYNNQFYKHEPRFVEIFSDGTPRNITDISYYKVKIIPRNIYKSAEADVKINWNLNTQEQVEEQYCNLYNSRTGETLNNISSPFEVTLTQQNNEYRLLCKLILKSDPSVEYDNEIEIKFNDVKVETKTYLRNSGYLDINVETINVQNMLAGWETVYIPTTSLRVFKNKDNTYSLKYDKQKYSDFVDIRWVIKSDNLNCDYYHCFYNDSNEYSEHISPTGILGYGISTDFGTRAMPPEHYNGFSKISLPEGKYKLIYLLDGDVGHKFFEVLPNQKLVIYPNQIDKYETATQNKYDILKTALTHSIEGLNP